MEKIIWTPCLYGKSDFKIYLDKNFAKEMIQSKIPIERQTNMNKLANEELKRLETNWLNPYNFYEDSCLITQIYIGQDGVWLSTNRQVIDNLLKEEKFFEPIEYNSHNTDTTKQAYVLIKLFNKWIDYSDALKAK